MNMDNKNSLNDYIMAEDIIGVMTYLKENYGVSEGFMCNKAQVKHPTYSRFKKGYIKTLGADKREALLNTVKEMYL